jgi:transposase-like protein
VTHSFKCPRCGEQTTYGTPLEYIFMASITCEKCGQEFLVEDGKPTAS